MQTDSIGLHAGEVRILAGDGPVPGYRAMPISAKSVPVVPVVLVIQDGLGITGFCWGGYAAHSNRPKTGLARGRGRA